MKQQLSVGSAAKVSANIRELDGLSRFSLNPIRDLDRSVYRVWLVRTRESNQVVGNSLCERSACRVAVLYLRQPTAERLAQ